MGATVHEKIMLGMQIASEDKLPSHALAASESTMSAVKL